MASEATVTVTGQLLELRRRAQDADRHVGELEARAAGASRELERATGPLSAYFEQVAAGEREADPAEEARLRAAVTSAQADVVMRPSRAHGRVIGMEAVNVRVQAELTGARRAAEEAHRAVRDFAADRFEDLAAERLPRSRQVGEQGVRIMRALAAWQARRASEVRAWRLLCELAGVPADLGRSPVDPLDPELEARLRRSGDVRGVTPIPSYLLDEGEEPDPGEGPA